MDIWIGSPGISQGACKDPKLSGKRKENTDMCIWLVNILPVETAYEYSAFFPSLVCNCLWDRL